MLEILRFLLLLKAKFIYNFQTANQTIVEGGSNYEFIITLSFCTIFCGNLFGFIVPFEHLVRPQTTVEGGQIISQTISPM